ncbi:BREX-2 system phosphatase PglZ [Parafrankia sp. BMG5.11]|uniref:BREX-2 system phosphatase PglZ n=1 Tax=Parafrankia sp. BMG5.11 TaxID=222540 RepID=UPI000DA4684D|nr:BREX-2 system phosphatase PglZ [Parafrankia sp. BMG5.11]TCJ33270.1 BREX-2 system phosphatase PglZ [Parafrankia sp. BMG5.11]SQD96912.1 PglZ domain protein [Parafrankia sp. Ea1.12]
MSVLSPAAGPVGSGTPAPLVTSAMLVNRVTRLLRGPAGAGERARILLARILLVRAQPEWPGPSELLVGGRPIRVIACVSPLGVLEEIARWGREPVPEGWLVLLTDADEETLGDTVLAQVHRQRVDVIEPWNAVLEDFGAAQLDPRLHAHAYRWMAQALLEARPAAGWPRRPGGVLSLEDALAELTAVRLGLTELGLGAADLDIATLLRWTTVPGATEAFRRLGDDERAGITAFLRERTGHAGRALTTLVAAGNGERSLALGLVCDCLWPGRDGRRAGLEAAAVERAKGRVERYFGDTQLDDQTMRRFADAVREAVRTGMNTPDDLAGLLDTADRLLDELDARAAGATSDILRAGFDDRLSAVATTLRGFLAAADSGVHHTFLQSSAREVASAVDALRAHLLAGPEAGQVERAEMAARVAGWLAGRPVDGPGTLAAALDGYLDDAAWADVALGQLAVGDPSPTVGAVYGDLYRAALRRRHALDARFARLLADWTTTGRLPSEAEGAPLGIEEVLDRVVAPVVTARGKALLVVLDGMSAAVAIQLAAALRRERWEECDPLGDSASGAARRRTALAVLPTVTDRSRASLLAGRLLTGDKAKEKSEFEAHPRWRRRAVRLFHHADLDGTPGSALDRELGDELTSNTPLVAVVINTIDDLLDSGRQRDDGGWSLADVGKLRTILRYARTAGRAVILTSDHGHVLDHGASALAAEDAISARHRIPVDGVSPDVRDGEVALTGSRVLVPGERIVALWDPELHYRGRKGGYHGGASAAEVTVPVLAFLPFRLSAASTSRDVPAGWRLLPDQRPRWWSLEQQDLLGGLGGGDTVLVGRRPADAAPVVAPAAQPRRRPRAAEAQAGPALFDLPEEAAPAASPAMSPAASPVPAEAAPATGVDVLVAALLASELFPSQLSGLARRVPVEKVEAAVRALLDAGGTLATTVVADRAGELPHRAAGFAVNLQRVFNVDNYPVLEPLDDGHTLRLNVDLLRQQFGLPA